MKLKLLTPALLLAFVAMAALFIHDLRAQPSPRRITITAKRFDFTPGEITLKKDEPVVIVFTSSDVEHGVKFKDLNLNIKAAKGKTAEIPFTPTKAGTFVGQCSVFCGSGHGSMKMTLHVTE